MGLLDSRKVVVAVKYGGAVAGTDAVSISNEEARLQPTAGKGSFKNLNGKLGNKIAWVNDDDVTTAGVPLTSFLTGNDATGLALDTLHNWDDIYKICGMEAVVDAGLSVTYKPSQTAPSTLSQIAVWRDGLKRIAVGVIGSLTVEGTIGEPISQTAEISGFTDLVGATEANPTASDINEDLLLVVKSTDTMTFTGTAYKGQKFTLTQGNDISKFYGFGLKTFERYDFDSTLEITYFKENENIYTDFANGTSHAIIIQAGSVNGKAVKISAPNAVVEDLSESSIDGKEAVTVKFNLKGDATGENQYSIIFGTM